MGLKVEENNKQIVLGLGKGKFDPQIFRESLNSAIGTMPDGYRLNLDTCNQVVNSNDLVHIIHAWKTLRETGREMVLSNVSRELKEVLSTIGLLRVVKVV